MGLIKKQEEFKPQEKTEEISFELLIKYLNDEDPQKRLLAARLLGNHKEVSIYLVDRLGKETHSAVRESIISSLASINFAEIYSYILMIYLEKSSRKPLQRYEPG